MTNIIIQPEVIKALADCVVDIIQNKIDWQTIDWQSVAEKAAERPKGKWIEVDNGLVSGRCSLCGWEAVIMETDVCGMPFCPNCGARMEK